MAFNLLCFRNDWHRLVRFLLMDMPRRSTIARHNRRGWEKIYREPTVGLREDVIASDSMAKHSHFNALLRHSFSAVSINVVTFMSPSFPLHILFFYLFSMAQNYGYETLMTELPTYMKQVLRFSIKTVNLFTKRFVVNKVLFCRWLLLSLSRCVLRVNHTFALISQRPYIIKTNFCLFITQQNGFLSALPYLSMWICSNIFSFIADWMLESGRCSHTLTRKIINSIGQYGPAICLVIASYTGCSRYLTVAVLTIGLGLNGGIYSGLLTQN